jgi:hypothetical protein
MHGATHIKIINAPVLWAIFNTPTAYVSFVRYNLKDCFVL